MKRKRDDSAKSVFDLTVENMDARFDEALENLKSEIFSKGLRLTYQDERFPTKSHFIRSTKTVPV